MKILFIGGTGNISEDCAELLLKRGHDIILLTRGRTTVQPSYRAVQADRKNINSMREALRNRSEIVINFLDMKLVTWRLIMNSSTNQFANMCSSARPQCMQAAACVTDHRGGTVRKSMVGLC